jgi:acetyltransferase-like isoleucine patch superfamily enzyme
MKINENAEIVFFPLKVVFRDKQGEKISFQQGVEKIVARISSWFSDFWLMILNTAFCIPIWTIRKLFLLLSGVKIGKGSVVHTGVRFFSPTKIEIGKGVVIGYQTFLDGRGKIKIGNHVDIASEAMIYTSEHNIQSDRMEAVEEAVEIGDYVFIGPRAIILPGVKVATGAVVAAGAVVSKSIPERKIYGGVPAKEIGERKIKSYSYRLGRARMFQ